MEAVGLQLLPELMKKLLICKIANKLTKSKITIEPWDYRFYAEKVRKLKYDLDSDEVKQYLQLDKLTDAMFYVAGELFIQVYSFRKGRFRFHEDVNVWEVQDKSSGEHIGLWYLDPYARQEKDLVLGLQRTVTPLWMEKH